MDDQWLARRFEQERPRLAAVAYRMLGSIGEAEDAVQEAWIRLSSARADRIDNLAGWLTTVVGRVCLDYLRSRRSRREQSIPEAGPETAALSSGSDDPESEAMLVDSVGLALLVVLETLDPAERLAFVLHDMFAVPFNDIARILDRTPAAARKLASRARRRVQGAPEPLTKDQAHQRSVVEAFLDAARRGDFDALVAVLDPDVVARSDGGSVETVIRGAAQVAGGAITFSALAGFTRLVLVDGRIGILAGDTAKPTRVLAFTVHGDKVNRVDSFTDPQALRNLDLVMLDGTGDN